MIDPFYSGDRFTLYNGDCLAVMAQMEACSVDAVVTDPPAGISFMGKEWDHHKGGRDAWVAWLTEVMRECLRVLKPGGHALVWAIPRTSHWTGWAIESAGFEVRDRVSHLFGTGFPKSLDVSKAIDRMRDDNAQRQAVGLWLRQQREAKGLTQKTVAAFWPSATGGLTGCVANWELGFNCPTWDQWLTLKEVIGFDGEMDSEVWRLNGRKGKPGDNWEDRQVIGKDRNWGNAGTVPLTGYREFDLTTPATIAAKQWNGWGTAMKPAIEDWWLCRKPLDGTVAQNVLKHGTGALNVDGCRIGDEPRLNLSASRNEIYGQFKGPETEGRTALGRWPANVTHDGSDEVVGLFPETESGSWNGQLTGATQTRGVEIYGKKGSREYYYEGNSGSAARFFYCAKPDKQDREAGLQDLPLRSAGDVTDRTDGSDGLNSPRAGAGRTSGARNVHPTIKSTELMRWLCRLITPPCGLVLDPFCGSGSTGKAAMIEGFRFIGIELSAEYCELAQRRIEAVMAQQGLFTPEQLAATQDDEPAQSGLFATVGE